jgi:hypothetical protein
MGVRAPLQGLANALIVATQAVEGVKKSVVGAALVAALRATTRVAPTAPSS